MIARNHRLAPLSIALSWLALAGATSCNLSHTIGSVTPDDSTVVDTIPTFQHRMDGRSETIQGTYQIQGNRLVSRLLDRDSVIESRYCGVSSSGHADSLIIYHDTIKARDTLAWSIRRDSLVLSYWQDTSYTSVDAIPTITEWIYARTAGTGNSLEGSFRMVGMRERFLEPLPEGSYDSASRMATWNDTRKIFSEYQTSEISFQAGRLVTTNRMVHSWADLL
ncbi:MAG TPA: hypothetical protein PKY05_03415, partial [Fibrobacteria bacterium]|nr:hypothetical protein [Fibrobacteria bacterium]